MGSYIHGHHDSVLRSHRWRTAVNSAGYLLGRLAAGQSLLDVGCGPGTLTADLASRVEPGRVVGIDSAAEVLVEARAATAGLANVEIVAGDAAALEFPDEVFDVVHSHQVLQHLPDPVAALAEMKRVCRPDGVVAARDADYRAMTWWPRPSGLDRWMDIYQATARLSGAEPDAGRRLLAWAQEAGFKSVTASASVWCFADSEDRSWWAELWAERVTDSHLAELAVGQGIAAVGELEEVADAWRRWGSRPDGWFAVLHGEVLCTV